MTPETVPHVLTYPRSGMHFFDDTLYKIEKIHFTKSHFLDEVFDKNNNKKRVIITIARDPIDSISSFLALENNTAEFLITKMMTEYIFMYAFLYEHADYVIDFNDLITYPDDVIKNILNLLNIDKAKYHDFAQHDIPKFREYKPSSKSLPGYNKEILNSFNFDLCYYYYNKLLEKKVKVWM